MAYIILGIAVGCWMYAFVNTRYNDRQWTGSKLFWWAGGVAFLIGLLMWLT